MISRLTTSRTSGAPANGRGPTRTAHSPAPARALRFVRAAAAALMLSIPMAMPGASPALAQANRPDTAARSVVTGAGSTLVFPAMSRWAAGFQQKTHIPVSYQPNGVASARSQIDEGAITFALTDAPFSAADLDSYGFVQWPLVFGAVVPVATVPGVSRIELDGDTLANIFLGRITRWSDPAIAALNGGAKLPDIPIVVVSHEHEGGGSTIVFNRYLSVASKAYADALRSARGKVPFRGEPVLSTGDLGVAVTVAATPGAIGYTDFADATASRAPIVALRTPAGTLTASPESFTKSVAMLTAGLNSGLGFADLVIDPAKVDPSSIGGWPMMATTFVVMDAVPQNRDNAVAALQFFDWIYRSGGEIGGSLGYVPAPQNLVEAVETLWTSAIIIDDVPLWPPK